MNWRFILLNGFLHFSETMGKNIEVSFIPDIGDSGEEIHYKSYQFTLSICSRLTIKVPKQCRWLDSGIFIVNFEHTSHLFLVFLWLILNIYLFAGYIGTEHNCAILIAWTCSKLTMQTTKTTSNQWFHYLRC